MHLKKHVAVILFILFGISFSYPLSFETTEVQTTGVQLKRDQLQADRTSNITSKDLQMLQTTPDQINTKTEYLFTQESNSFNRFTTQNSSNAVVNSTDVCMFTIEKDDIKKAKEKIFSLNAFEGQGNVFFIHLEIPLIDRFIVNVSKKYEIVNSLLEWQFVNKEEKFLVQLPVDFDLITFDLLKTAKEQSDITIPLYINNSICKITDTNKELTIDTLRTYLWKELLLNFTNYLLCNREFITNDYRSYLYYVTTIWEGYDLTCFTSSLESGPILVNKDELIKITPFLCYFLSLQFVWLFAILWRHAADAKHSNSVKNSNYRTENSKPEQKKNIDGSNESKQSRLIENQTSGGKNEISAIKEIQEDPNKDGHNMANATQQRGSSQGHISRSKIEETEIKVSTPKAPIEIESLTHGTSETQTVGNNSAKSTPNKKVEKAPFSKDCNKIPFPTQDQGTMGIPFPGPKTEESDNNGEIREMSLMDSNNVPNESQQYRPSQNEKLGSRRKAEGSVSEEVGEISNKDSNNDPNAAKQSESSAGQNGASQKEENTNKDAGQFFDYRKRDRPYGLKRILMKCFYFKLSKIECKTKTCCNNSCSEFNLDKLLYNLPSFRLMFMIYILILFPFGLFRTLHRKKISDASFNDYQNVMGTSEPLFSKIHNENIAFYLDTVYATAFPLIGVFFCTALYEHYMKTLENKKQSSSHGITNHFIVHIQHFKDLFLCLTKIYLCCFQLCSICFTCKRKDEDENENQNSLNCIQCRKIRYCRCINYEEQKQDNGKVKTKREEEKSFKSSFYIFFHLNVHLLWHFINSILPIISFVTLPLACEEKETQAKSSNDEKEENETQAKSSNDKKEEIDTQAKSSNDKKEEKEKKTVFENLSWIFKFFMGFLISILYILFSFIILRPMVTTFTFVLRALTYILFVAMPVRITLFTYLLIGATTLFYFSRYYVEILDMFSDILKYVFEIKEGIKSTENSSPEKDSTSNSQTDDFIKEEMFTYIVSNLIFVKKRIYYFIFKCTVVLLYLFITLETILISGKSTTESNFKDFIEIAVIIVSPYAVGTFMTASNVDNKFTQGNMDDITGLYNKFNQLKNKDRTNDVISSCF